MCPVLRQGTHRPRGHANDWNCRCRSVPYECPLSTAWNNETTSSSSTEPPTEKAGCLRCAPRVWHDHRFEGTRAELRQRLRLSEPWHHVLRPWADARNALGHVDPSLDAPTIARIDFAQVLRRGHVPRCLRCRVARLRRAPRARSCGAGQLRPYAHGTEPQIWSVRKWPRFASMTNPAAEGDLMWLKDKTAGIVR